MYFFIFCSVVFCSFCYLNLDPMKSSFFLIFALLSTTPVISFSLNVWYSYFICLLFLSGIFVILVYFTSLSKINFVSSKGFFLSFFLTLFCCSPILVFFNNSSNLMNFYYNVYYFYLIFIILMLLFFMNFSSYFLNFSGALRKV